MEVFAQVKSVSFYHSSKELYLTAVIIEKKLKSDKKQFVDLYPKDQITLKTNDFSEIKEYLNLLVTQDCVIISSNQFEIGKDRNNNSKTNFIIDNIRKCDVFKVKSNY